MSHSLKAEARQSVTKSALKQLRATGKIPGVVYGNAIASTTIHVSERELLRLLRKNPHSVIDLAMPDGANQTVMISGMQKDPLKGSLLHIDFHQIRMDELVRATVAVELDGEPQGVKEGGVLQVLYYELEIQCLPRKIPDKVSVDISRLGLGESLYISDVILPEDIELRSDPQDVLVTVLAPQKEIEVQEQPNPQDGEGNGVGSGEDEKSGE